MMITQDKTKIEDDWACSRLYWYRHVERLEPVQLDQDLLIGRSGHLGLKALAQGDPEPELAVPADGLTAESHTIATGLVTIYAARVWPRWMQDFELVGVEEKYSHEHNGVRWVTIPDLLLRARATRDLWWVENKFFAPVWGAFGMQYEHATQIHLGAWVVEQARGEPVAGCFVQGLSMGGRYKGRPTSRAGWAYRKPAVALVSPEEWSCESRKGFEVAPVGEFPGGLRAWATSSILTADVVADMFPVSMPIFKSDRQMQTLLKQRTYRARVMEAGGDIDAVYPQNFGACVRSRGRVCPMHGACWGPKGIAPEATGLYRKREVRG